MHSTSTSERSMAGLQIDILLLAPADTTFPSKQQSEYTGPSLVTWFSIAR